MTDERADWSVNDPRIDPRLKAMLAGFPSLDQGDVESREAAVAAANTPEARRPTRRSPRCSRWRTTRRSRLRPASRSSRTKSLGA